MGPLLERREQGSSERGVFDGSSKSSPDWERFFSEFRKPGYIEGYSILQKLGGGVFGIVYKAKKESIAKTYAIKFLKVDDPAVHDRVLRELAQVGIFAQVDHPNLVSIEDRGVVDGIPYIVMGYAGDETLEGRLSEGPLSEEETLSIVSQVCRGVRALHDRGLAHFDLKPANIFLKGSVARVGDYGLSKLVRDSCQSLSCGRGTPYYMAPEMLRRKADHRADIYSLGVIFYECLEGRPPFGGENEWEVLKAHEEAEVVFGGRIPGSLRPILRRMLAKDPKDRYPDLGKVLSDLRSVLPEARAILLVESAAARGGEEEVGEPELPHPSPDRARKPAKAPPRRSSSFFMGFLASVLLVVLLVPGFRYGPMKLTALLLFFLFVFLVYRALAPAPSKSGGSVLWRRFAGILVLLLFAGTVLLFSVLSTPSSSIRSESGKPSPLEAGDAGTKGRRGKLSRPLLEKRIIPVPPAEGEEGKR